MQVMVTVTHLVDGEARCCTHPASRAAAAVVDVAVAVVVLWHSSSAAAADAYTAVAAAVHVLVALAHLTVGEAWCCTAPASRDAATVVGAVVAVVVLSYTILNAVAYAAASAAVQVLVALAHRTVGRRGAVPLLLLGLLLLS